MKFIAIIALSTLALVSHTTAQSTTAAVTNPLPSPIISPSPTTPSDSTTPLGPSTPPVPDTSTPPVPDTSTPPVPDTSTPPVPGPTTTPVPTSPIFIYSAPTATTEWTAGEPATISWTTPCTFYEPTTTFLVYLYLQTAEGRVKVPGIPELGSLDCKNPGKIPIKVPVTLPENNGYSILVTIGEYLFYSDPFTIHIAHTPSPNPPIPEPIPIVTTTVSVTVYTSILTVTVPGPKPTTTSTTVTTGVRATTTSGPRPSATPLVVPEPKPKPKINGAVLGGVIAGVVVVAIAITSVVFRRKCPGGGVSEEFMDFNPVTPSNSTAHQGTSEPDHFPSMGGARKVLAKGYEPPSMSNAHGFIAEQYEPEQYEPPPMSNKHRFTSEQYEPPSMSNEYQGTSGQYEPPPMSNEYRGTSGQYEPPPMSNEYQGTSGQYEPPPMSNEYQGTSGQYEPPSMSNEYQGTSGQYEPPPMSNEYQGTSGQYEPPSMSNEYQGTSGQYQPPPMSNAHRFAAGQYEPPSMSNEYQGTSGQYGPSLINQREMKVVSMHGPQLKPGSLQSEPTAGQRDSVSSPRSTYSSTPWVLTGPSSPSSPQGIINMNPLDAYLVRGPQNNLAGTSSVVRSPQMKPGSLQSEPTAGQRDSVSSPRSTYSSTPWVLTGPSSPSSPQGIVNMNPLDAYLVHSPQNNLAETSSVVRSPQEHNLG